MYWQVAQIGLSPSPFQISAACLSLLARLVRMPVLIFILCAVLAMSAMSTTNNTEDRPMEAAEGWYMLNLLTLIATLEPTTSYIVVKSNFYNFFLFFNTQLHYSIKLLMIAVMPLNQISTEGHFPDESISLLWTCFFTASPSEAQ